MFLILYAKHAPGLFQDKLDDSAYKVLTDFQTATVTLLALMSAATGEVSKVIQFYCYNLDFKQSFIDSLVEILNEFCCSLG